MHSILWRSYCEGISLNVLILSITFNLASPSNITLALMAMTYIRPANDYLYYGTMGAACPLAIEDLRLYTDIQLNNSVTYIVQPSECDSKVNKHI